MSAHGRSWIDQVLGVGPDDEHVWGWLIRFNHTVGDQAGRGQRGDHFPERRWVAPTTRTRTPLGNHASYPRASAGGTRREAAIERVWIGSGAPEVDRDLAHLFAELSGGADLREHRP